MDCLFDKRERVRGRRRRGRRRRATESSSTESMLRGFASKCLDPISPRRSFLPCAMVLRSTAATPRRYFYERYRRSGDGRKREWFEERSAANQDEYFRRETARQLRELRRALKRKAEQEEDATSVRKKKTRRHDVACSCDEDEETNLKR